MAEVHDQLKVWMDDNYQRSVSQAVSLIVEHFLKKDGRPLGDTDLAPRVDGIEPYGGVVVTERKVTRLPKRFRFGDNHVSGYSTKTGKL